MNPLNVLRGTSVMTPASALRREGDALLIAPGPVHVRVDEDDRPIGVSLAGREGRIVDGRRRDRHDAAASPTISSSRRST